MNFVGIDIAKPNHWLWWFLSAVFYLAPLDQNSHIIGLESTSHYVDNRVRLFISRDFKVCVLNPLITSSMRKKNIRKTITDKVDTFVIAKTLIMQDFLRLLTLKNLDYIEFKELAGSVRRPLSSAPVRKYSRLLILIRSSRNSCTSLSLAYTRSLSTHCTDKLVRIIRKMLADEVEFNLK